MTTDLARRRLLNRDAVLRGHGSVIAVEPIPDMRLLDSAADSARQGGLAAGNFDGSFDRSHGADSTNLLVEKSTSTFVETRDKALCTLAHMARTQIPDSLQGVIKLALAAHDNNQSELAKVLTVRMGKPISQQRISYLLNGKDGKLPRWSELGPFLLEIARLKKTWTPAPPMRATMLTRVLMDERARETPKRRAEPLEIARTVMVKTKKTGRIEKMELTSDVIEMARALMDMDKRDRLAVARKITALQVRSNAMKDDPDPRVTDARLEHLAAPNTPTAQRAKARKAAVKPKTPSRHSQ